MNRETCAVSYVHSGNQARPLDCASGEAWEGPAIDDTIESDWCLAMPTKEMCDCAHPKGPLFHQQSSSMLFIECLQPYGVMDKYTLSSDMP